MIHPNYSGVSLVEHGGNLKGVGSWMSCAREKGVVGVALTTLTIAPSFDLLLGAINIALGLPVHRRRRVYRSYECPAERPTQYEGIYQSQEQFSPIRVKALSDSLDVESDGIHYKARPVGVDTFVIIRKGMPSAIRFIRDMSGRPWGLFLGFSP